MNQQHPCLLHDAQRLCSGARNSKRSAAVAGRLQHMVGRLTSMDLFA